MLSIMNARTLPDELWQSVVETAGPLEIHTDCANCLRAWIRTGVERMETEGRLTPEDLAIAHANLRNFVRLVKIETVFLSPSKQLECDALYAARRRLQQQASLTAFALWPFWLDEFMTDHGEQSL